MKHSLIFFTLLTLSCISCKTNKNIETASTSSDQINWQKSVMQSLLAQDSSLLHQFLSIDSITVEYTLPSLFAGHSLLVIDSSLTDCPAHDPGYQESLARLHSVAPQLNVGRVNTSEKKTQPKVVLTAKGISMNSDKQNAKTIRSLEVSDDTLHVSSESTSATRDKTKTTGGATPPNMTIILVVILVLLFFILLIKSK